MSRKVSKISSDEAISILSKVLSPEVAEGYHWHRVAKGAAQTAYGYKLIVKELAKFPDPDWAAEYAIKMDWRGFDATWVKVPLAQASNFSPDTEAFVERQTAQLRLVGGGK